MTRRIKKYNTRKKKSHKRVMRGGKFTLEKLVFLFDLRPELRIDKIKRAIQQNIKTTAGDHSTATGITDDDIKAFIKFMRTPDAKKANIIERLKTRAARPITEDVGSNLKTPLSSLHASEHSSFGEGPPFSPYGTSGSDHSSDDDGAGDADPAPLGVRKGYASGEMKKKEEEAAAAEAQKRRDAEAAAAAERVITAAAAAAEVEAERTRNRREVQAAAKKVITAEREKAAKTLSAAAAAALARKNRREMTEAAAPSTAPSTAAASAAPSTAAAPVDLAAAAAAYEREKKRLSDKETAARSSTDPSARAGVLTEMRRLDRMVKELGYFLPIPEPWKLFDDTSRNKLYYANTKTGETIWNHPSTPEGKKELEEREGKVAVQRSLQEEQNALREERRRKIMLEEHARQEMLDAEKAKNKEARERAKQDLEVTARDEEPQSRSRWGEPINPFKLSSGRLPSNSEEENFLSSSSSGRSGRLASNIEEEDFLSSTSDPVSKLSLPPSRRTTSSQPSPDTPRNKRSTRKHRRISNRSLLSPSTDNLTSGASTIDFDSDASHLVISKVFSSNPDLLRRRVEHMKSDRGSDATASSSDDNQDNLATDLSKLSFNSSVQHQRDSLQKTRDHSPVNKDYNVTIQYTPPFSPTVKREALLRVADESVSIEFGGKKFKLLSSDLDFSVTQSFDMNTACRDRNLPPRKEFAANFAQSKCIRVTAINAPPELTPLHIPFIINFNSITECDDFKAIVDNIRATAAPPAAAPKGGKYNKRKRPTRKTHRFIRRTIRRSRKRKSKRSKRY
jgi:hypothetical protein